MAQTEDGKFVFDQISEDGKIVLETTLIENGHFLFDSAGIKTSSIGLGIIATITKQSSIGLSIQGTKTKESSIGLSVIEEKTKESSLGITIPLWGLSGAVGDAPASLAVYDGKLYAACSGSHNVYVFDGNSWTLSGAVGTSPVGLAVYNGKLYATCSGSHNVYVFDGESWTLSGAVGYAPYGLAVYDGKLYAACSGSDNVYVFDGNSWTLSGAAGTAPVGLAVYDGKLYAACYGSDNVYVFDGESWTLSGAAGTAPVGLAVYDGRIYVTCEGSDDVYVQSPNTKQSSIGLTVQETNTKESSVCLTVIVEKTKQSSIGLTIPGAKTKESSIGLTVLEEKTKQSSIGLTVLEEKTKQSSIGMLIVSRKTKQSSIGLTIPGAKTKESSIGLTVLEEKTKQSSIGLTIPGAKTKESSIGMCIYGSNTKESTIGLMVIESVLSKGFFYAKLGSTVLYGLEQDNFRISKEINRIPSFEFEIANCDENRTAIANGITNVLNIYWLHHGAETLMFSGIINADGIEYNTLDSITITGYASYVKLAWPFHKHLAAEDAENVNIVLDYDSSYTDYTTAANNATVNDVLISFGATNHAFYIGADHPFWGLQFKYSTAGVEGEDSDVVIEYSKTGSAWSTLDVLDESEGFTKAAGTYDFVIPHPPSDWVRSTVSGEKKYWVRFRINGPNAYTTAPKLDRIYMVNVDIYRTYYFDTSAREILLSVLADTEYTMDATDECPEDEISIVAEYESPLRLIAAIPNALTWTAGDGSKKAYQWWIDDAKKVHIKQQRGTVHDDDITGYMTIFNNHEDYFHISNRIHGLGPRDGLSQMRAIIEDKTSITTHELREIAVAKSDIGKYLMLKNALEKDIAISKGPMQRIKGAVTTEFWGRRGYDVGDSVTLHQDEWNVSTGVRQIVKVDIGPNRTVLNLGISQEHLEGLKNDMQRQLNLANVQMHGSTTLFQAGPERMNYQRVSASEVYPAKLEIEIPSEVKKIHKVLISWTTGPYRADVGPQTDEGAGHDHGGWPGDGGAVDADYAGAGGDFTPDVLGDGDFTPAMLSEAHKHLTETTIIIDGTVTNIGVLESPDENPNTGDVHGGNHRHRLGITSECDPIDTLDAVYDVDWGSNCATGACIDWLWTSPVADNHHDHIMGDSGYTNPPAYVNVWDVEIITSLDAYAFSETSYDESPAHLHDGVYEPVHDHTGVYVADHSDHLIPAIPAHSDHLIETVAGFALNLMYAIYECAGGTTLELLVNDEKIGEYSTPQTELRIDGYLNSGGNTVQLRPVVGQNVKGGAEIQASGMLFVEPVKF